MRSRKLTKAIQSYDRELFVDRHECGALAVYRKTSRADVFTIGDIDVVVYRPHRHLIFALTDTWSITGTPTDWGVEPLLARLKAMDLWQNDKFVDQYIREYEKRRDIEQKDFRNNVESFLIDFRRQFARATNDVNTSTLAKLDKRRLENGNRQ